MTILGIETSCDETAAAIITGDKDRITLRSSVLATSLAMHAETGGIIPEQAARQQVRYMLPVIQDAIKQAGITLEELDAIAVTYGPGLIGSLLVGVETAKTLSYVLHKPLIPINHMLGHIYANWIIDSKVNQSVQNEKSSDTTPLSLPTFPLIALVVSGGHTDLLLMKSHSDIKLLGGTRDDAAGECFDKCARLLGYPYPGGPKISQLAEKGNPKAIAFPRPMLGNHDYQFSFSGLKTSFLHSTKQHFPVLRTGHPQDKIGWQQVVVEAASAKEKHLVYDLCASLQEAIIDVLVKKTMRAAKEHRVQSVVISGGVSANQLLRDRFTEMCKKEAVTFFSPAKQLSTDNAAMIASAAYFHFTPQKWQAVTADPELYFD